MLTEREKQQLDEQGVLFLPAFASPERVQALRERIAEVFAELGDKAGAEFKLEPQTDRLANVVNYGKIFEEVVAEPKILAAVGHVLGAEFKLSSLNARSARPHSDWVQPLHCDMGLLPDEKGNAVCNVIWLLDDFTPENGATRYVPGTHRAGRLPNDVLADALAPHPDEVLVLAPAGAVFVINSHVWHGGTANRTPRPRLALHSFYCRRDIPQQQHQKSLLSAEVQAQLSPELRKILALDDPLNDELGTLDHPKSGFLD
jgi:ectoine hydroxylase-related dioxygenase (phytanoyl-CoA dioxygenase family)